MQYVDYAVWQRGWLQGEVLAEQLEYWRNRLEGVAALALPVDYRRPAVLGHRGGSVSIKISPEITQRLKELSRKEGVTLFMSLLAGFQVLLWKYTGQKDVAVGTPIAGRRWRETEALIGFFVNTLVLRMEIESQWSVRDLLQRTREVTLGAYEYQDIPFEKLVEELRPERDLSRTPLFQVSFGLENREHGGEAFRKLKVSPYSGGVKLAKFELNLDLVETGGEITGEMIYAEELFAAETIERMSGHFLKVLEVMTSGGDIRMGEATLLTEAERLQMVEEWNQTAVEYSPVCVQKLFEEQVERTPDATALVYEGGELSYADLNRRANQLGNYLRSLGVGPDMRVGLCLERSPEMVIAILGVLKAGAAYVPLDISHPILRLATMLEEAQAPVLVTRQEMWAQWPSQWVQAVCIDTEVEAIARCSSGNMGVRPNQDNLAYVMFTSGSTGRPKGVMVTHAGLSNYLKWALDTYPVREGKGSPLHTSMSFDLSLTSLFPALATGQSVIVMKETEELEALVEGLHAGVGFSIVKATPSHLAVFREMLSERDQIAAPSAFVIGGEALSYDDVEWLRERAPATRLINEYGPTETVVGCCVYEIGEERGNTGPVPIGRPIANTQLYVLDGQQEPAPLGVPGELYIGGAGLARGYLNRADITAERFVPHPFSRSGGERLYRTGDLVRWKTGGDLEFLGRIDHQVKIRGFRIELGEIEAVVEEQVGVRQAAVIAREVSDGDETELVAYVVAEPELKMDEIRQAVRERLPEYMVPRCWVRMDSLPLTANGKLDTRMLPAPEQQAGGLDSYTPPRNPAQEMLGQIWEQVLGVERIGIRDNFFDRGGHSLLATQVASRVRAAFAVELPLQALFEAPTVEKLADRIEQEKQSGLQRRMPPVKHVERAGPLPLSYAQQRLWFMEQLHPGSTAYNVPLAVQLEGHLDVEVLRKTLEEILRRHEVLRTSYRSLDGVGVQQVETSYGSPLSADDLSGLDPAKRETEVMLRWQEEQRKPFDLTKAPMLRARLLLLDQDNHILLFTMHHIASDGWSSQVLIREMVALYESLRSGKPSPLPDLELQYADYAAWQREWLQGEVLEQQLSYWCQQLASVPALDLPTDHARPVTQSYAAAREQVCIPAGLTGKLRDLCRAQSVTMFMILISAWQVVLGRWAGQDDFLVGTDVANRRRAELEDLAGFFVNQLMLRGDLSGNPTLQELLARTRKTCLAAYDHQDIPFERIVEELAPERDLSRNPLFQVMFVWQNLPPMDQVELSALRVRSLPQDISTVKFDLTLNIADYGEELRGSMDYSTDLFEGATVRQMLRHLEQVLEQMTTNSEQRLSEVDLLSSEERELLLMEWNRRGQRQKFENDDAERLLAEIEQMEAGDLNELMNGSC